MTKTDLPTLEDVARAASVSTATVSRCLNSPDKVSASTRDKVLKIISDLGYSPHFGARALAANKTNTFGAIIPTMANAIFAEGLQAFQDELTKNGATFLLASSNYDQEQEEDQIRSLVARGAEGLLLVGTQRRAEIYQLLDDRNIPVVITWAITDDAKRSFIGFDNFQATYELTQRALKLGHQRFVFLSAYQAVNDRAKARVEGVRAALEDANISPSNFIIFETSYSIETGREMFRKAMELNDRPTIVMCGNDVLAAGAFKMARDMKLSIPSDVSITGFDNIELASLLTPSLTTVAVPHYAMGQRAAQVLLNLTQDNALPQQVTLTTIPIEGLSLAAPKN